MFILFFFLKRWINNDINIEEKKSSIACTRTKSRCSKKNKRKQEAKKKFTKIDLKILKVQIENDVDHSFTEKKTKNKIVPKTIQKKKHGVSICNTRTCVMIFFCFAKSMNMKRQTKTILKCQRLFKQIPAILCRANNYCVIFKTRLTYMFFL